MWYLWIFGDNVEDRLGHGRFIVFYLLCGIVAAFGQILIDPQSTLPTIGASGAIAGVMGAYFVLYPQSRVLTLIPLIIFWEIIELPAIMLLGFWFLMQLFSAGAIAVTASTQRRRRRVHGPRRRIRRRHGRRVRVQEDASARHVVSVTRIGRKAVAASGLNPDFDRGLMTLRDRSIRAISSSSFSSRPRTGRARVPCAPSAPRAASPARRGAAAGRSVRIAGVDDRRVRLAGR